MRIRDDDRGVAIQVGAAILLAFVVLAITVYQTQVVPDQNREIEVNHNQQVLGELQEVRNAIVSVSGGGSGDSVSVTMGTTYPERTIFANPPPPSGQMRTTPGATLAIANATATGETGDYWNGTIRNRTTRALVYAPTYYEYETFPVTTYENTVLANRFSSATVTESDQRLVRDNTISLVTLQGEFQEASRSTVSVDLEPVSTSTRTVTVTNPTPGDPVRITIPTTLEESTWSDLLEDQYDENGGHVVGQTYTPIDDTYARLTLTLERGESYVLEMTAVGVGTGLADPGPAYVTSLVGGNVTTSEGTADQFTVEVRDRYNNPVSGVELNFSTARGDSSVTAIETVTDGDGRVTLRYEPPGDVSGTTSVTDLVNVSYATGSTNVSGFDGGTAENLQIEVTVTNDDRSGLGGGGGGPYDLQWDRTEIATEQGIESCDSSGCTYNLSNDPDDTLPVTANTTPDESGVYVDFSNDDATVVDGFTPSETTTGAAGTATADASIDGNGTVNLTVASVRDVDTLTLTVVGTAGGGGGGNSQPSASFTYSPSSPTAGDTVSFSSTSSDTDGSITGYQWDFGDGSNAMSANPDHPYSSSGTYTVTLTVTDDDGATDTTSQTVTVSSGNSPPTADAGPDQSATTGDTVELDGTGSSDPDGDALSYSWTQTAGQSVTLTDPDTATPEFTAPSVSSEETLTFSLSVSDGNGGSDTDRTNVTVSPGDTSAPVVTDATVTNAPINYSDASSLQTIAVTFNESMNTSVVPTVKLVNLPTSGDVTATSNPRWTDATTFRVDVDIPESNGDDGTGNVSVSGAEDDSGNVQSPDPDTSNGFRIDTDRPQNPSATTISPDPINASTQTNVDVAVDFPSQPESGTVEVRLTGPDGATVTQSVTANTGSTTTTVSGIDVSSLADGTVTAEARILDDLRNENPRGFTANSTAIKDTASPAVDVTDPSDGATVSDDQYEITATVTDSSSGVDESSISVTVVDSNTSDGPEFDGATTATTGITFDPGTGTLTINASDAGVSYAEGTVDVSITADDDSGNSGSETSSFTVDVPAAEQVVSVNPRSGGRGQSEVRFDVVNQLSDDVTITAIALNSTTDGSADRVLLDPGDELVTNRTGTVNEEMLIDGTIYDIQGNTSVPGDSATLISLYQVGYFKEIGNGNSEMFQKANVKGETFTVTLLFADGSQKTVELTVP